MVNFSLARRPRPTRPHTYCTVTLALTPTLWGARGWQLQSRGSRSRVFWWRFCKKLRAAERPASPNKTSIPHKVFVQHPPHTVLCRPAYRTKVLCRPASCTKFCADQTGQALFYGGVLCPERKAQYTRPNKKEEKRCSYIQGLLKRGPEAFDVLLLLGRQPDVHEGGYLKKKKTKKTEKNGGSNTSKT